MGKGEAQLSDRKEEKGEEIEGAEKGKNRVRRESIGKKRGKDGERDREGHQRSRERG